MSRVPVMPCSASAYEDLARRYSAECDRRGWVTPEFRILPGGSEHVRSIKRAAVRTDGPSTVSVRLYMREFEAVLEDMAAGVLVANGEQPTPELIYRLSLDALDIDPVVSLPPASPGTYDEEPF